MKMKIPKLLVFCGLIFPTSFSMAGGGLSYQETELVEEEIVGLQPEPEIQQVTVIQQQPCVETVVYYSTPGFSMQSPFFFGGVTSSNVASVSAAVVPQGAVASAVAASTGIGGGFYPGGISVPSRSWPVITTCESTNQQYYRRSKQ